MPEKYVVQLSQEEREQLVILLKTGKCAAKKRLHAGVLLKADEGEHGPSWPDESIAEALEIHSNTVKSVRKRLVEEGLESALNRKPQVRPSHFPKLDGEKEAKLIALACSAPPEGRVRWTLRLLADKLVEMEVVDTISYETVRGTLKKTNSSRTSRSVGSLLPRRAENLLRRWKTC
jgi:hypothetical protein